MTTEHIDEGTIDPVFCSIPHVAEVLSISEWSAHKLVREHKIDSRYFGRRRLVVIASLRQYIAGLPSTPEPAG